MVAKYPEDCCATCGTLLSLEPTPGTWDDHGFCNHVCALKYAGGFHLLGHPAQEMAEYPGTHGGPGFERDLILDWIKAATPSAPIMLARLSGDADIGPQHANSWSWRLYSGGTCLFQRLTAKGSPNGDS